MHPHSQELVLVYFYHCNSLLSGYSVDGVSFLGQGNNGFVLVYDANFDGVCPTHHKPCLLTTDSLALLFLHLLTLRSY